LPTRRFDGPDLDTALARARAEVGNGARVLSAERVRSGGLGGFFAKERVEIEVEVGADVAVEVIAESDPEPTPANLLDLVDMVSRAEHQEARAAIRPDRVEAVRRLTVDDAPPDRPVPLPAPPVVSTETATFAEILERITAQTAAPAPIGPPPPVHHAAGVTDGAGPTAGDPTALDPTVGDPAAAEPAAGERTAGDPAAAEPAAEERTAGSTVRPGPAGPDPAPTPAAPMRLVSTPAAIARVAPPFPGPLSIPSLPSASSEPGPLARLGLPPELEPADGLDLRASLLERLATLPRPSALPCTRGTVVAVIGPRGVAHHVARAVSVRVGADPASIATLTARRRRASDPELTCVEEVLDNRRAWRRRPLPSIAVIDAPLGRPTAWVAEVLGALEPTVVWGVVEASRKVEDIVSWSNDLGGLDALCLTCLDETVSPASPLRTGLPIALLEGQPATADRWADLLLSRLAS
jgi:hypothetical protein